MIWVESLPITLLHHKYEVRQCAHYAAINYLLPLQLSLSELGDHLEVICEFDAPNDFVTTTLSPTLSMQIRQSQFAYMSVLGNRMDGCEQSLEPPCLIDGATLNRGQMSGYAQAEGSWVSAAGQVVNFVYQQSINGTSSNCWIYPKDCRDSFTRYCRWRRILTNITIGMYIRAVFLNAFLYWLYYTRVTCAAGCRKSYKKRRRDFKLMQYTWRFEQINPGKLA